MTKEKAKELALISSYIVREDLLYGTVFQTFDIAYSLAEEFYEIYEEGETLEKISEKYNYPKLK